MKCASGRVSTFCRAFPLPFIFSFLGQEGAGVSEADAQRDDSLNHEEAEGTVGDIYSLVNDATRLYSFCCLPKSPRYLKLGVLLARHKRRTAATALRLAFKMSSSLVLSLFNLTVVEVFYAMRGDGNTWKRTSIIH